MSIFSTIFGSSPAPATAPAAPAPAAPEPTPTPAPADPMDQFKDLWKPSESPAPNPTADLLNLDPKQVMEAAGKIDFTKFITTDQMQAIAAGGETAMNAFAQAMNKVAQTVYAQNTMATSQITQRALAAAKEQLLAELPQHIKNTNVSDTLRAENPAFSHPAAAPILGALQQQLSVKFPNATSSELSGMAKTYLSQFATAVNGPAQTSSAANQQADKDDWSNFLN